MSLWTEPPRIRQFRTLDEFPAPGLDALGATATQALYDSPLRQIQRRLEDSRARDPYVWEVDEDGARIVGDKPQVDRTTAIDRAKAEGVDLKIPDAGVTEDYLKLLIKRKKEYQQRQDVIDRGPKGVVFGTAQFVSALGASLLDPLNLAASFVPVGQLVAPAMALRASQAATLGARTAARAGVGAIEGAVGQALLEPLTYYSYDQEQLDYTVVNSLQNIAFGALLGSAAHTGFGLIRDKLGASAVATPDPLNKLDPGVQQEILKIRVADLLEGKTTDVTPIIRAARAPGKKLYHGTNTAYTEYDLSRGGGMVFFAENASDARRYAEGGGGGRRLLEDNEKLLFRENGVAYELRDGRYEPLGIWDENAPVSNISAVKPFAAAEVKPSPLTIAEAEKLDAEGMAWVVPKNARIIEQELRDANVLDLTTKEGMSVLAAVEPTNRITQALVELAKKGDATQLSANLWAITKGASSQSIREQLETGLVKALAEKNYDGIRFSDDQHKTIALFDSGVAKLRTAGIAEEATLNADDLARAARNRNLPEADRNADFDALRDVDNTVGPEPKLDEDMQRLKEDTDEMLRQANETAQQMNLELPELKAADELEAKLRQYIKAVNAAATCGIRG